MFSEEIEVEISIGELYILSTSSTCGLKGLGEENKPMSWDHGRLAKAVRRNFKKGPVVCYCTTILR